MMIRFIALIFLFLSGITATSINKFGQDLCVYEYLSRGTVTYFKELYGVSANDPSMLGMCGIFSIIFFIILLFIRNKFVYLIVVVILLLLELIFLNMIETAPYQEIIYDSITQCSNYSVLLWVIFKTIFLILSGFYLLKQK